MAGGKPNRHSNAVLAAFAGPCLPFAALGLPLVVHLPAFYAESVGLPLAVVGIAFTVVKLLDILVDPLLGSAMDRTRSKFGRFKPWLAAGVPLLMIATFFLFLPAGDSIAYMTFWLLAVYVGFSIAVVGQTGWAATLSPDYDQRSRIYGWWQAGNILGVLLVLIIPVVITQQGGSQADGVAGMAVFIIALLPITIGIALWKVPEPKVTVESHAKLSDYMEFFRLTSVRRLLLCDLFFGLAPGITGALALFYMKYAKGMAEDQANILIFCYFAAGLVGAPIWTWLATKIGKHRALAASGVAFTVAYVGVWFAPAGSFPLLILSMVCVGIPYAASALLLRAMMADVSDEDKLTSGQDRTGMLYALLTATSKAGFALAVGLTYIPLQMAGFDKTPGAVNGEDAIFVLKVLFVVLPMILLVIASWIIWTYPLDEKRQEVIRAQLEARAEAG